MVEEKELNKKKQELLKLVSLAEELERTMKTKGWTDIIQPLLDKMIMDCIGFKKGNGEWSTGAITNLDVPDSEVGKMFAYRQGLIEFHNRVLSHKFAAEQATAILNRKENKGYTMPMRDTRYSKYEGGING